MSNDLPAYVTGLTIEGTDVQRADLSVHLDVIVGLNDGLNVRGKDTIVPGLAGRTLRNRKRDTRDLIVAGVVQGTGSTEGDRLSSAQTLRDELVALFDPTGVVTISGQTADGQTRSIDARPGPIVWNGSDSVYGVWNVSIALESVVPDWTLGTVTPVPDPVSPPPPDSGGVLTDLTHFTLIFAKHYGTGGDTFRQSDYYAYPSTWGDTRWNQGDHTNGGKYSGFSNVSQTSDGLLISLLRDGSNQPRSTALVPLPGGVSNQLYGRYYVRFKSANRGLHWKTAWLLWPQSNVWPRDGEIDFVEGNLSATIGAFMHRQGATSGSDQAAWSSAVTYAAWHEVVLEWTPTRCEVFIDGASIGSTATRIPNTPMHLVLQTETALDSGTPAATASIVLGDIGIWSYTP